MNGDPLREKAERKAYRLLALRAHSEKELRAKLREGGVAESVVAGVVDKCRGFGYLDDGNFARQRARELAVNRLAGDRRIAVDLRERGIAEELSMEAIAAVREELSEEEALDRLLQKRSKGTAIAALDGRERARLARGLMGKGFPAALIFRKLKGTKEEGFHDDDGE
jgi:regulatory protein